MIKKILFVVDKSYLPKRSGGIQVSTHELATAIARRGIEVCVLCRFDFKGSHVVEHLNQRYLSSRTIEHKQLFGGYQVIRSVALKISLVDFLKRSSPDAVVFQTGGKIRDISLLQGIRKPAVIHFRDAELQDARVPNGISGVFTNSNFVAQKVEEKLKIKAKVFYNFIEQEKYFTGRPGNKVGLVNPIKKKGLEVAIGLAERNPDIPFIFIESWPLSDSIEKQLKERIENLENVEFRHSVRDMREFYSEIRLLLVPSQWEEAWGRVVCEAQCSGIPVIASNIGGLPESVSRGGVLLDPKDNEAWCNTLRDLWSDEKKYGHISNEALKRVKQKELDKESVIDSYLSALSEITAS